MSAPYFVCVRERRTFGRHLAFLDDGEARRQILFAFLTLLSWTRCWRMSRQTRRWLQNTLTAAHAIRRSKLVQSFQSMRRIHNKYCTAARACCTRKVAGPRTSTAQKQSTSSAFDGKWRRTRTIFAPL